MLDASPASKELLVERCQELHLAEAFEQPSGARPVLSEAIPEEPLLQNVDGEPGARSAA